MPFCMCYDVLHRPRCPRCRATSIVEGTPGASYFCLPYCLLPFAEALSTEQIVAACVLSLSAAGLSNSPKVQRDERSACTRGGPKPRTTPSFQQPPCRCCSYLRSVFPCWLLFALLQSGGTLSSDGVQVHVLAVEGNHVPCIFSPRG